MNRFRFLLSDDLFMNDVHIVAILTVFFGVIQQVPLNLMHALNEIAHRAHDSVNKCITCISLRCYNLIMKEV